MENINNIRVNFINNNEETPFTSNFVIYIEATVNRIFPSLDSIEKNMVNKMVKSLVTLIFFRFNFETENQYYLKLKENNNQDLIMIILLLFPYMNDENNYELHHGLKRLSEIGTNKKNGKYVTNIQYDRSFFEEKREKDYEWNLMDLYNNYITAFHTIYRCSHHLYCNWMEVIPLTLDNYQKSEIYKQTVNITDNLLENSRSLESFKPTLTNGGLDIRDYYHAFINDLYLDILPYKWLLYERYDTEKNTDVMFIQEIFNYFGYIFTTVDEDYENNKNTFINKWSSFIELARTNSFYKEILYQLLNHFDFKVYTYLTTEDRVNFKQVNVIKDEDKIYERDDDYILNNKEDTYNKLIETYNKVTIIPNIYEYLKDTIYQLSFTWYGKLMFPDKKFKSVILLKDIEFNKSKIFGQPIVANSTISYKNIYNFAKSLLINDGIIYKIREWDGLTYEQKRIILNRFNANINNWFFITNNLRLKYGNLYNNQLNNNIYGIIKPQIKEIVFHCLITRGILSEFKVKHSPVAIKESLNSYYYVTQRKYTDLEYTQEDKNDIYLESFVDKITGQNSNNRIGCNKYIFSNIFIIKE